MGSNSISNRLGGALAAAALLGSALAGCAAAPPAEPDPADAGTRFVACLQAAGVEAQLSQRGYALVRTAWPDPAGRTDPGAIVSLGSEFTSADLVMVAKHSDGSVWEAARSADHFGDDPDTQRAYAACAVQHPDFAQPDYDPEDDPDWQAQLATQRRVALQFANCARADGFAWVADPTDEGSLTLPADLTEAEFRAVLTACLNNQSGSFEWSAPAGLGFDWRAVLYESMGFPWPTGFSPGPR
ncbi:MAG: hypothetical protein LBJ44_08570 [Propionibacteriaceae bacterium]|jgi:hypothetical protein|nr:hypothetical protein [Propionibacteriaceae bacterium]